MREREGREERGGKPSARLASDEFTPEARENILRPYTWNLPRPTDPDASPKVGVIEMQGEGLFARLTMERPWDAARRAGDAPAPEGEA